MRRRGIARFSVFENSVKLLPGCTTLDDDEPWNCRQHLLAGSDGCVRMNTVTKITRQCTRIRWQWRNSVLRIEEPSKPSSSASEVTTIWRYTNVYIIIIIKQSIAQRQIFSRFNANLSDNRMNELHCRLPSWRHRRPLLTINGKNWPVYGCNV